MANSQNKADNCNVSSPTSVDKNDASYNPEIYYQAALDAGFSLNTEKGQERVLYLGNLDKSVTEEFITGMFGKNSKIVKIKVISNTSSPVFAFVEFEDHDSALRAMNNHKLLDDSIKVQWVTRPSIPQQLGTVRSFDVFVGNLSLDVDRDALEKAFLPFGDVFGVKVICDHETSKSKGYGFVSFSTSEKAQRAIDQMNGMVLNKKPIRTHWASRKQSNAPNLNGYKHRQQKTYDEIRNQTVPENSTIYVRNIPQSASEEEIRKEFGQFGAVVGMRVFRRQGYSFIKFDTRSSATNAILHLDKTTFMGNRITCWWGKPVFHTQAMEFNEHTMPNLEQQYMQQASNDVFLDEQQQYYFDEMGAGQQKQYGNFEMNSEQHYASGDAGMIAEEHHRNWQQQYYQQYYSNPFVQHSWQGYGYQPNQFSNYYFETPQQHLPYSSQY